jgi:hypothetical protein
MRRFALALALCALFASASSSQFLRSYGLKAAYTVADQPVTSSVISIDTKSHAGFNAAVFAEWLDLSWFSVVTQLEYVQRGMEMEFVVTTAESPEGIGTRRVAGRVNYLSLPILAKVEIPLGEVSPYVLAGPRLDYLISYRSDDGLFDALYKQFRKTLLGASFGAGLAARGDLPVTILLEARYNIDLQNSYATPFYTTVNKAFDVWVGIGF